MPDAYKEVKTYRYPNAIVRVHIPDLTPEEREKRMKIIADAAGNMLKSMDKDRNREVHSA